jgi:Zn-dependent M28 family amino/carboxypeptidase
MFESINPPTRPNWMLRITLVAVAVALGAGFVSLWQITQMPLTSYKGPAPPLSDEQRDLASRLSEHVTHLATTIGERNIHREGSLPATAEYLRNNLLHAGYAVAVQSYNVEGHPVSNLEAWLVGSDGAAGAVVVGAHYDSVAGTVGADDNASGVAATLELARMLQGSKLRRTIRFVLFVNEEPPYFQTEQMGSFIYARQMRHDGFPVSAMVSLEMLGFYSDVPGSQKYPSVLSLFYPSRGDFIGFVGNRESRDLVRRATRKFRESAMFPSEGIDAPATWPGIGWSDQWSFWQQGYPAIMITDTALFRNPYYHTPLDTVDKLDFEKMARVVDGVRSVVVSLGNEP